MDAIREIHADIKEIKADVKVIASTLEKNTQSLIVHELRTTLAEKRIERFEAGVIWTLGLIASTALAALVRLFTK